MVSGGKEANAYWGQGKMAVELKHGCGAGAGGGGGTGGMTQLVQNRVPCLPPGLLPHLFYSVPREENSPTWAGKAEGLICKAKRGEFTVLLFMQTLTQAILGR